MLNISGLFFVNELQRTPEGQLNFLGAVWDTITIRRNDPPDGGCQLIILMQTDEPNEPGDTSIEVKTWRTDTPTPTVNQTSYVLEPGISGRNRFGAMLIPGAFFREPGDYVLTAALGDRDPSAYLRVAVVAVD